MAKAKIKTYSIVRFRLIRGDSWRVKTVQFVPPAFAAPRNNLISTDTPLFRTFRGKSVGATDIAGRGVDAAIYQVSKIDNRLVWRRGIVNKGKGWPRKR